MDTSPERVPEILDVMHREVASLVAEVRGIIDDLGPVEVDLVGSLGAKVGKEALIQSPCTGPFFA